MVGVQEWRSVLRDATQLAWRDFGGTGPSAVLLHGLAGHASEWEDTAAWLTEDWRVVALDQRGHGRSERSPKDVSREAHEADVVALIEELNAGPVLLVGQSLGGHLALLVAARHPRLVRGLVVVEASPVGGDPVAARDTVAKVGAWLRAWPVPFADRAAAVAHFGGPSLWAEAWASGLQERAGGLWPGFDVDVMERTLAEGVRRDYWREWEQISCPTLIVRAGNGTLDAATADEMLRRLPHARLREIPDASHDVHLDRPQEWRAVVQSFLGDLDAVA